LVDKVCLFNTKSFCFSNYYYLIRFLSLFQCDDCLTYNVEPTNFTVVTPLNAMKQTSLRDFPTFKNDHRSTEKIIPGKFDKIKRKKKFFCFSRILS